MICNIIDIIEYTGLESLTNSEHSDHDEFSEMIEASQDYISSLKAPDFEKLFEYIIKSKNEEKYQQLLAHLFYINPPPNKAYIDNLLPLAISHPKMLLELTQRYIHEMPAERERICDYLTSDPSLTGVIKQLLLPMQDGSAKQDIFSKILLKSIEKGFGTAIMMLKEDFPDLYVDTVESLGEKENKKLNEILGVEDIVFYTNLMMEFTIKFGKINYDGGLLTAAQVSKRKEYDYHPTILPYEKLSNYLEILKDAPHPIREKFVLAGPHWICGEISIDQQGEVKILLVDSLGTQLKDVLFKEMLVPIIFGVFKDPPPTVYLDDIKRQNAAKGCSTFALDDIQHLYVAEKYLPEEFAESGLFGFLEKNKKETLDFEEGSITLCNIPLSLIRTAQTSKLADKIEERSIEEQSLPVNKKGETALVSATKGYRINPINNLRQNHRLNNKLQGMAEHNHHYLVSTPKAEVEKEMQRFTLESLSEKMGKVDYQPVLGRKRNQ